MSVKPKHARAAGQGARPGQDYRTANTTCMTRSNSISTCSGNATSSRRIARVERGGVEGAAVVATMAFVGILASDPTNISKERLLAACIIAIAASGVSLSAGGASSTDDSQLREVQAAAQTVPWDLRPGLPRAGLAAELRRKDLGDGLVHRVAYQVARSITWDAGRTAM